MIDLVLFAGRILLVVLMYVFLFAAMRAGVGLVRGQRKDAAIWSVDVEKGMQSLRGLHVDVLGTSRPPMRASRSRAPRSCSRTSNPSTERSSTTTPSTRPSPSGTVMRSRLATRSCA